MSDREADQRSEDDFGASPEAPRFLRPWRFVASVPTMVALPPEGPVEIAFAGRSNVGKSSLLNALVGRKGLARASNTPGRTQALNFFVAEADGDRPEIALVDMPGYGYAEAPKAQVDAWNRLVRDYLRGRVTLKRVYVLVDARHGLKANDDEVLDLLDASAVSYALVLTKSDKVKPTALARVADETRAAIARRPAAFPGLIVTSAERNVGIDELRIAVEQVIGDATRRPS